MRLDYRAVGVKIRKQRIKKKWTQEMLASVVGISSPHMSNIERGRTKVSLGTLLDIANALDTTMDELLCEDLVRGRDIYDEKISQELKACSEEDIKIVYETVKALVDSLCKRKG